MMREIWGPDHWKTLGTVLVTAIITIIAAYFLVVRTTATKDDVHMAEKRVTDRLNDIAAGVNTRVSELSTHQSTLEREATKRDQTIKGLETQMTIEISHIKGLLQEIRLDLRRFGDTHSRIFKRPFGQSPETP